MAKVDRRVQRTRQLLYETLVTLIVEKGYEAVTVQEIIDRANLGRSTFYSHYRDKDDLLFSGFEPVRDIFLEKKLRSEIDGEQTNAHIDDLSLAWFRHAYANQKLYKALSEKDNNSFFLKHAQKYLGMHIQQHFEELQRGHKQVVPLEVVSHYLTTTFLGLLSWWIDHEMPYSPEEMDRMFKLLVMPGLMAVMHVG